LGSNFDLNVMMPVIAFNLLQSIDLLTSAADHLSHKCVDAEKHLGGQNKMGVLGIEADETRCRDLIELSLAMCTALAPRIGYDMAASIAKRAYQDGTNVRQVALERIAGQSIDEIRQTFGLTENPTILADRGVPTAEEIESLLDPRGQTIRGTGAGGSAGG
jgi:fumarate hydratase class II